MQATGNEQEQRHVRLYYRHEAGPSWTFENAAPLTHDTDAFHLRLEDDVAEFAMTDPDVSIADARLAIQEFINGWETWYGLRSGIREIELTFDHAVVEEPLGHRYIHLEDSMTFSDAVTLGFQPSSGQHSYLPPPQSFRASPLVTAMWTRYLDYVDGREPLAAMGYVCLSMIETEAGLITGSQKNQRASAGRVFAIDPKVLAKIGHLCSAVGDERTGRKITAIGQRRPHTPAEEQWITAAVRMLIRRAGEYAHDRSAALPTLTMADVGLTL